MSISSDAPDSAKQAQRDANDMGMNEDDERDAKEEADRTGEPRRDALGNEDGAS